ncbi:MAG: hypothetical protein ABSE57_04460 [Bryobacteraceae bacterium]
MSTIHPVNNTFYVPPISSSNAASPSSTTASSTTASSTTAPTLAFPLTQDEVQLSLAGRIALGVNDGKLTSSQGQQLDAQLQTINQQITSGGSGIGQLQSQLSEQIYGDGHNGATIPTDLTVSAGDERDFLQAGRVVTQESAGNLTSSQGSQFFSQISQIYQQSQNGASASATNQAQNQLSVEIYDAAHGINNSAS